MLNSRRNGPCAAAHWLKGVVALAISGASCTSTTEGDAPDPTASGTAGGATSGSADRGAATGGGSAAPNAARGGVEESGGASAGGLAAEGRPSQVALGNDPVSAPPQAAAADPSTAPVTGGCWTSTGDGQVQLDPTDKLVLFDGTSLAEWKRETGGPAHWNLLADGTLEVAPAEPPTDLQTNRGFEDLCVHVEYMTPAYPASVLGQLRGNSGIYLKSAYELQILDSIGQPATLDSCGAVYSIRAPLAVACNPELVWNTYEIEFDASEWSGSTKTKDASVVLVTLNGVVVQRDVPLNPEGGATAAGNADRPGPQPLLIQDHRNLIKFRNIWVKVPRG